MVNRRMQKTLNFLVHPDQTGFVPGRQMTTNLDAMDHYFNVYGKKESWMLGMLDFRKAYDSVSQEWIIMVLEHVGFPPRIINSVQSIQAKAASTINIRGVLSGVIPILSGVRQGCPLSPTLFAIAIDPFIRKLESVMIGLIHMTGPPEDKHSLSDDSDGEIRGRQLKRQRQTRDPNSPDAIAERNLSPRSLAAYRAHFAPQEPPPEPPLQKHQLPSTPMIPETPRTMKVSAFADDVALFMSCYDDVKATGRVIMAFQNTSKLSLNPTKTVFQWVKPPQDRVSLPDPILNNILARYWPSAPPKHPDEPRQFTVPQPSGTLFRYLGIHFGDKDKVTEHYAGFITKLETLLRQYALFGLKHHSKAWLLNMFFLSKLVFYLPYVTCITEEVVKRIRTACCDKINGTLVGDDIDGKRTFKDELIYQPLMAGGIGLLNIVEQAKSLRAARAARFFRGDSAARQNALFHFASETVDLGYGLDSHPAQRMANVRWFENGNWHWGHFLSSSMNLCLRKLVPLSPVANLAEPQFEFDSAKWSESKRKVDLFDRQRQETPIATMSQEQVDYLMEQINVTVTAAKDSWREKYIVMKNKHWLETLPPVIDPDHMHWLKANKYLSKHYRRDARSAATLHMLRLSRLPFTRWYPKSEFVGYKDIGCSSCQLFKEKDYLHEHLFVNCPASKALCQKIGVPLPTKMADWILREAEDGPLNHIRELAHALWQFERAMRRTGLLGTDPEVQRDYAHLFTRASAAYRQDELVLAAKRVQGA